MDACNLLDGSLVVRHDGWLDLGDERLPIPTLAPDDPRVVAAALQPLEPILEIVAGSQALLVFDWKGLGFEDSAAALLARHGLTRRTVVSTSVVEALAHFRKADPALTTGLTVPRLSRRLPPAPGVPALARRYEGRAGGALHLQARRRDDGRRLSEAPPPPLRAGTSPPSGEET